MATSPQEHSIHLFRKLAWATGEDALTEAFAGTLRLSPFLQDEFLRVMGIEECAVEVTTQPQDYPEGIPDLRLRSSDYLILVEVKLTAPLTREQWDKYQAILDRQSHVSMRKLVAIVGPNTEIDSDLPVPTRIESIYYWADVYRWAVSACRKEHDAVARFVLAEFRDLLEGFGMAPFQGFSEGDLDTLGHLHGLHLRMESFLREVVETLSQLLPPPIQVKYGGFKWETYKDDPEMYPAAAFGVLGGRIPLRGWVAVKLSSGQTPLILYLWSDSSDQEEMEKLTKYLPKIGFEYDSWEEAHYCALKTRLSSTAPPRSQVRDLAEEISGVAMKTLSL